MTFKISKLLGWFSAPEEPDQVVRAVGSVILEQDGGQFQINDDVPIDLIEGMGILNEANLHLLQQHREGHRTPSMYVVSSEELH